MATILVAVAGAELWAAKRFRDRSQEALLSVSSHDEVLKRAADEQRRSDQLSKEGAAQFSYQMSLAARAELPRRFEQFLSDSRVTTLAREPGDKRFEYTLTAATPHALFKFLGVIEKDVPELRLRSAVWASQGDGTATVNAVWDVWPIPKPSIAPPRAGQRP